jgi:L-threonylcarbamoyladenylate synthase
MYPPWTSAAHAARILAEGGIVAIPTETVYGLAGNAFDTKALAKIFAAKKRPFFDPLIIHIPKIENMELIAKDIPKAAWKLAKAYWPGPMTLVLPKRECIPDLATSALPTVAIRCPAHEIAREIISLAGVPLAAPSANLFQHVSPTTAEHVAEQLGDTIDGIVDGGPCSVGVESTIIAFPEGTPVILRPGAVTPEMIRQVADSVEIRQSVSHPGQAMPAPGMMDKHYQPRVPLFYGSVPENCILPPHTVRIAFGKTKSVIDSTLNLSPTGNLTEATANLYAYMRALDKEKYDLILVDSIPDEGVGIACNDRLRRASLKHL